MFSSIILSTSNTFGLVRHLICSHVLVTPLHKKDDRHNPSNCKPISLTCVLYKLLEHIISSHIMTHLEKHDLISPFQHGFRHSHSTETQLVLSMNKGKQVDMVDLDFSKAFDKVSHPTPCSCVEPLWHKRPTSYLD